MSESLNIDPSLVRMHAGNVENLAEPLGQASRAAQAVSAPTDAFGKICAFLPPLFVDSVETDGIAAIQAAVDAVGEDGAELRGIADSFTTVDDSNASRVKAAEDGLSV